MLAQKQLSDKTLKQFGLILAGFLAGLFGILLPFLKSKQTPLWPWMIAGILFLLAVFTPKLLKWLYGPWMKLGNVLGWINTRIILGFIYFFLITPMGLIMRCVKHDPLKRTIEPNAVSYREPSEQQSIQHMERPY